MTEQEWLAAQYPGHLLAFLQDEAGLGDNAATRRKYRLFACACCRRVWPLLADEDFRRAVQLSEAFADHRTVPGELQTFHLGVVKRRQRATPAALLAVGVTSGLAFDAAGACIDPASKTISHLVGPADYPAAVEAELCRQCDYLRDIFPFRKRSPVPLEWLISNVVKMANAAYAQRCFDSLPVLADALEEAGCTAGPHVLGCWVVDLILGKE